MLAKPKCLVKDNLVLLPRPATEERSTVFARLPTNYLKITERDAERP
jgi:hypothetical protein